jgi:hypothetical protein
MWIDNRQHTAGVVVLIGKNLWSRLLQGFHVLVLRSVGVILDGIAGAGRRRIDETMRQFCDFTATFGSPNQRLRFAGMVVSHA